MSSLSTKVLHVKSQGQTRQHHCHWPGCDADVPPAKWGCSKHWFTLPKPLRDRVWAAYVPGQEVAGTPSAHYVAVAREVQDWISSQDTTKRDSKEAPVNLPAADLDAAKRVVAWLRGEPREHWDGLTKRSSAEAIDRLIQQIEGGA